jgi:hypothetical protein
MMTLNVGLTDGSAEVTHFEARIVVNHPEASESGTCRTCDELDGLPVAAVGLPPFHPNCVCTAEWKQVQV